MHERARDFGPGLCVDCEITDGPIPGLVIQEGKSRGLFTSAAFQTDFPHVEAVLSLNLAGAGPEDTGLAALVSVRVDDSWTPWFVLLRWGQACEEVGQVKTPQGQVDTDVLRLESPASTWRYQIIWRSTSAYAVIRRVALSFSDQSFPNTEPERAAWGTRIAVPFISQWSVNDHPAERVCSPTAVAMVGNFYGIIKTADDWSTLTYDSHHEQYGNWSVNMLAVSQVGLKAVAAHSASLATLEKSVMAGHPVVTSVAYASGALSGAPQPASAGHLVVVAGFTDTGDVWVRDPAAKGDDVWLTYQRQQFEQAWLGHGGLTYQIQPEEYS